MGSLISLYSKVLAGVQDQVEKERIRKILEKEKQQQLKRYHKHILNPDLPTIPDETLTDDELAQSTPQAALQASLRRSQSVPPKLGGKGQTMGLMSMSTALGGKAKPFGAASVKKKKKKHKKKRKFKKR